MSRFSKNISDDRPRLKEFCAELDRTGVISEDFKSHLYGLASAAISESYYAGRAAGITSVGLALEDFSG